MKLLTMLILMAWLLAVLLGHWAGLSPDQIDLNAILQLPDAQHWLGTDDLGRDILARVLHGLEVSLSVAVVVTVVTMLIGIAVGLLAGYSGGKLDAALMQLTSIFLAFPGMLLAIALRRCWGQG